MAFLPSKSSENSDLPLDLEPPVVGGSKRSLATKRNLQTRRSWHVALALLTAAALWSCSSDNDAADGGTEDGGSSADRGNGDNSDSGNGMGNTDGGNGGTGGNIDGSSGGNGGSGSPGVGGGSPGAGGSSPVVEPEKPLDERVEVFEVELSGTANNGSTTNNTVFPAARPGGGLTLGWNEGSVGHLMRLDADMKPEGVEWDFPGLMIVGALGLPDDGVALLFIDHTSGMTNSFSTDRHLRLRILDAEGKQTRETSIVGGNGIGVGADWFSWSASRAVAIVAHGDRFAIFTKISHTFPDPSGTHQGDLYIEVDADGNLDEDTRDFWSASHSNMQHLVLGPNGEDMRLIVGDANPFGLEYQTSVPYSDVTIWPSEEQQVIGEEANTSSVAAGDLCGFQYRDGRLYATVASGRSHPYSPSKDFADVLLLSWDSDIEDAKDVSSTWLTETPSVSEDCPTLTAFGDDHQLTVWGSRDGTTATLALLDDQGKLVSGPTASDAPFHGTSIAVPLPGGDVAWTYAGSKATKVQVSVARAD